MFTTLIDKCHKYQYVSFDIFDTLIKRTTRNPREVFMIADKVYIDKYGNETHLENYADIRVNSEREARKKKFGEVTLDDIFKIIAESYTDEIAKRYKEIEINTEMSVCVSNHPIKKVYDFCVNSGKKVFITSDMYLPQSLIEKILKDNGYTGYEKLYLSNTFGKTKIEGNLYDQLLYEQKIEAKELLHIGDNKKADVRVAKHRGIKTALVRTIDKKYKYKLDERGHGFSLYKFCTVMNPYNDLFSNIGYGCFGPLLYGFVAWIKKMAKERKYDCLFFLSRDGYIMHKVYEVMKDETSPKSEYFLASRRALQVAAIHFNPEFEYVTEHMFIPRVVSMKWLLKRWGLNPDKYKNKINLEKEFQGADIVGNSEVRKIYSELKTEIINNSLSEYDAFKKYVKEKAFRGNVAIVDIGWYGNMQNSLMEMLSDIDPNIHLAGYYLGIVPDSAYQEKYDMNGYLFQRGKNEELYFKFKYMSSMMELFFMAPHGSTKRYAISDNEVKVEFSDFEYTGTNTYEAIKKLQSAALKFILNYKMKSVVKLTEKEYLASLFERLTKPTLKEARILGDMEIWDDKWIKLAPKHSIFKWIICPKKALEKFLSVPWKMGYLKRNIKVPLRYDLILYKIRNLYKKV